MAHTKKEKEAILKKEIKVASEKKLLYIEEVCAYLPINKKTFYEWKQHESNELKETLENNKIEIKTKLRHKMIISDNATLIIALYKLVCNEEERKILADNKTIKIEDMPDICINIKERK